MRSVITISGAFVAGACLCMMTSAGAQTDEPVIKAASTTDGWKFTVESHGVKLYSRVRAGTSHKEFKAMGTIAASSTLVHRVLDDVAAYPHFMPYTVECRLVKREGDASIEYQRLDPPLCSPRDYTLRITESENASAGDPVYRHAWQPANSEGPAEKPGVVRVRTCEGGWLLEPSGPNATLATYTILPTAAARCRHLSRIAPARSRSRASSRRCASRCRIQNTRGCRVVRRRGVLSGD